MTFTNCVFNGNVAVTGYAMGGGMASYSYFSSSPLTLTNCLFSGNETRGSGTMGNAIYNDYSSPAIVNGTFSANVGFGGTIWSYGDNTPIIHNTIMWNGGNEISGGSATVAHSIIQGGLGSGMEDGGGNLDADPRFVDATILPAIAGISSIGTPEPQSSPAKQGPQKTDRKKR